MEVDKKPIKKKKGVKFEDGSAPTFSKYLDKPNESDDDASSDEDEAFLEQ